ncbi:sigma-70 family RNA polymerase sigma factor [Agrococcus sp. SL85]|uniref:sigma-70 family RNA polymerase sigma factor n=1 Tax=Agrococcus sp. SL85 TaxID=2995141 RepID=UPI00226C97D2|nr:sigma-70 family RNA polymerase sigma factor [Agrococcus sp. SL85]WAC66383.1 sigma-70 family RNA polymerase sigma factor [Agrococcus sp. SL85]
MSARWELVVAELVAERGEALVRYATLLTGNEEEARDMVQDALAATFGRLRNGFAVDQAEAYVRRAIANRFLDTARRRQRWRRISPLVVTPERLDSGSTLAGERLDMAARLEGLAPRERACIVLRYDEDRTVEQIAAELGISQGAVKRYLSDALGKLRGILDRERLRGERLEHGEDGR